MNEGFFGLTAVEQNQREPTPGRWIPGRQFHGETQVFDRLVKLPELPQYHRQVPVRLGKIRPQLDGATEVRDRLASAAGSLDRQTESAQNLGIVRIELQRRLAAANRARQLPEIPERFRQREMKCRDARPLDDCALQNFDRAVMFPALVANVTDPVQRRRIRRLTSGNLAEQRQCGVDFAGLVQLGRLDEDVFGRGHGSALIRRRLPSAWNRAVLAA